MADIISTIRNALDRLKRAERRVAECVLREPHRVIRYTITELAEKAETSEPTVVRFCRKIGLEGYMDLRLNIARDMPSAQYIHETVDQQDSTVQVMEKLFAANQEALGDTLNKINMDVFEKAVDVLTEASRIELYGSGGSGLVARDAQHKFFRLGVPCIAYEDSHMQVMSAALLSSCCVVIAISATGSTKDVIESVRVAQKSGAQIIGITGRAKSPLGRICDYHLPVHSQESALWLAPMSTRIAQISLIDALFVSVAIKKHESVKEKLGKVKQSLIMKRY
jgi:RpiR family carbohydrate utilization transcriptional regulator